MTDILETIGNIFVFAARIILPVLCFLLIFGVIKDLLKKRGKTTLAKLLTANGLEFDICSVESIIGRSKICDVVLNIPSISRRHAVITYSEDYGFKISSVYGTEILVNGTVIDEYAYFNFGDIIEIGGLQLKLVPAEETDIYSNSKPKKIGVSSAFLLTLIQGIMFVELMIHYADSFKPYIPISFGILFAIEWVYFLIHGFKGNINIEILGFFLTTIGFAVAASATPDNMLKQLITAVLGIAAFIVLQFVYKNMDFVMKLRYYAGAFAILILGYNLIFGVNLNGAKNWIFIGNMSLQPSEFVKVAYIYVGAATLDRLFSTKNLIVFIGFSAVCVMALALMSDFGTALIFFVTFLVISFMRSGSIATVALAVTGAGMAGFLMLRMKAHVARRFAAWGHVWEDVYDLGYQQTHALSAGASGGLFGKGAGNSWLKDSFAANTDTVFSLVCEELGLLIAICAVLAVVSLAFFAVRNAAQGRSAYYSIAACATASMFLIQLALNVFGSVDILPFTGVTFPFVSRGGTSVLACWMLLAFIKAGDTRKGASFVVKAPDAKKKEANA